MFKPRVKKFTFKNYPGEWVEMVVNPSKRQINEFKALLRETSTDRSDEEADTAFNAAMLSYVKAWSFADEDGAPLPLDLATLEELPQDIYDSMFGRWMKEVNRGLENDPN